MTVEAESLPPEVARVYGALKQYVDILASRGIDWGIIGPREKVRLWERHVLNSLALLPLIPQGSSVADVGSGAGLPGLPLALVRRDIRVDLIEPLLRRCTFLSLAVDELGLEERVQVVRARAEEHGRSYDVVVCRAVAPLPRLLAWSWGLVGEGGSLLALKGSSAPGEVASARAVLDRLGVVADVVELAVPGTSEHTWAVRVHAGIDGRA